MFRYYEINVYDLTIWLNYKKCAVQNNSNQQTQNNSRIKLLYSVCTIIGLLSEIIELKRFV